MSLQEFCQIVAQQEYSQKKPCRLATYLHHTITNLTYNIKNSQVIHMPFVSRRIIQFSPNDYTMTSLLGNQYNYQTRQEFYQKFQEIVWMTYRTNGKEGDVGWGCMIRVVQMLFAQVFKRYFKQATATHIIQLFREQSNGPFSIVNICKKGSIQKRFTSSPQIYSIMSSLICQPCLEMNFSTQNYFSTLYIKSQQLYTQSQFPKLITISTNIGQSQQNSSKTIKIQYLDHLVGLMRDKTFCGLVGGVGNQALFVVGDHKTNAIILDPHYVQMQDTQQIYFQKVPKALEFVKLKSSVTLNFYFQDLQIFGQWVDYIILMHTVWNPYLCFDINIQNPQKWIKNHRKKSQDFQMLS